MFQRRELLFVIAALAVTIGLAVTKPRSGPQERDRHDIEVVRAAANQLSYATVSDAWKQDRLGAGAALSAITEAIHLRLLATHQEGDAIILTFVTRSGRCVDLVSQPYGNSVEARDC